jgi:hypothetical protein
MTIRHTVAAVLAASAIAAPAASAMPAPPDMQASRAQAAAQERQQQDLRGEAARDAALHPRKAQAVDAPGATAADSQAKTTPVAPGQPTWAVNPKPLTPPSQSASTTSSDDGIDWATVGIGVGITLLVMGCIVALTSRSRQLPRTRISA